MSCAFVQRAKSLVLPSLNTSRFMIVPLMKLLWAGTKFQLVPGWWFEIFHPSQTVGSFCSTAQVWQPFWMRQPSHDPISNFRVFAGGSCEVRRPNWPKKLTDEFWWRFEGPNHPDEWKRTLVLGYRGHTIARNVKEAAEASPKPSSCNLAKRWLHSGLTTRMNSCTC